MFVIDRRHGDRVYYINSKRYRFHKDFVNATYISLERGRAFFEHNYLRDDRRFILGDIAFQTAAGKYTFEFWEGDLIPAAMITEAHRALTKTFFAPLAFKPTSLRQEDMARSLPDIPHVFASELGELRDYEPLNIAHGVGQLRILGRWTPETVIDRNQIAIFREVPLTLTPLSGVITLERASPLSHINMLARGWGIPNAYIKNADVTFKQLENQYVYFETRENDFVLRLADPKAVEERQLREIARSDLLTPAADLEYSALADLHDQRARDSKRFGAKSANLGEVIHARIKGVRVPPGFTIPFRYYREFLRENGLDELVSSTIEEDRFVHDPVYRKTRLAWLRETLQKGKLGASFRALVLDKVHREYFGKGVFVRSSTNSEDLPNFSGAGLYTTVPNARADEQILEGIKTVWASIWNFEAYEARESFGINHLGVYPAVLIQEAVPSESSGVLITTNPFDPQDPRGVYINAKRGLGIRVVEGKRVPEQIIYRVRSNSIQVLTRSNDDTLLALDEHGGVKEVASSPPPQVLTRAVIRELVRVSLALKRVFHNRDQDIEWAYAGGKLYILQSRPYIERREP